MTGRWADLGRLGYEEAWAAQRAIHEEVVAGQSLPTLLLVEHPPVLTLGASFHSENLLRSVDEYTTAGIDVVRTDRGGDVTYHGPGQLVIYPVFNLDLVEKDLHRWMRLLEETMLLTAKAFGLQPRRFPPHTGAWIGDRKLAAIGVKVRKWVSMHGIALNCDNGLEGFEGIIPCGIRGFGVTSLTMECHRKVTIDEVKPVVVAAFERVFGLVLTEAEYSPHRSF